MIGVKKRVAAFLTILFLCFGLLFPSLSVSASAGSSGEYTSILDDLQRDDSFSEAYYPPVSGDYSLNVIQLAESTDRELFVYVYQPSGQVKDLRAASINLSTTINDEISYFNYKLRLLNSSGVFYKYIVEDFTVKQEPTRYYAISSIYRPFDDEIDSPPDQGEITEVNYPVARQYCFGTLNGKPFVQAVDIETITITDKLWYRMDLCVMDLFIR